jgi:hypothetical protein
MARARADDKSVYRHRDRVTLVRSPLRTDATPEAGWRFT